jgi:hypothetical protein
MDYQTFSAKLTGRNSQSRKLANNTTLLRIDPSTIAVQLHSTNVVTFHADGRIVFDSGGWKTSTTKQRMGEFSPALVSQSRGAWEIRIDGQTANYADGITWNGRKWTGAGEDSKAAVKLAKRAAKYARDYMTAFDAGEVSAPSNGDCWGCLMVAKDDRAPMGGADHILSHIEENYFVPSLLTRSIDRFPVSQVAKAYISDKWAGTSNGAYFASIDKEQLYKSLYRYVKAELGLAS